LRKQAEEIEILKADKENAIALNNKGLKGGNRKKNSLRNGTLDGMLHSQTVDSSVLNHSELHTSHYTSVNAG
jgi:hypothetical protein